MYGRVAMILAPYGNLCGEEIKPKYLLKPDAEFGVEDVVWKFLQKTEAR